MSFLSFFTRRRPKPAASSPTPKKHPRPAPEVTAQVVLGGAAVPAAVARVRRSRACLALRRPLPEGRGDLLTVRLFNGSCLHSVAAQARVDLCERDGLGCRVVCRFLSPLPAADLLHLLG